MTVISDRPIHETLVVAIMAFGLAGFAGYHVVYRPAIDGVSAAETRLAELRGAGSGTPETGGSEDRLAAERTQAERREALADLEARIPSRADLLDLLDSVAIAADSAGVEVTLLQPVEAGGDDLYPRARYLVGVFGVYHGITDFVTRIASLTWIVSPAELRVSPGRGVTSRETVPLEAALTLETYVHASDSLDESADARQ